MHLAYTRFDPKDQNAGYDVAMARCPLVIGHGLFGSRGNWSGLARKFSLSRRVFVVDHRNHGDSPHCLSHTYQEMAGDLKSFIDDVVEEPAIVLGHSMGGKAAMGCAVLYPESVRSLIVCDIAPVDYAEANDGMQEVLKSIAAVQENLVQEGFVVTRHKVDEIFALNKLSKPVRQFLLKSLIFDNSKIRWQFNAETLVRSWDFIRGFPWDACNFSYSGSVLVMRGGLSSYVNDKGLEMAKEFFHAAHVVTLPNAGHWLHADAQEEFFSSVHDWLGEMQI